MVQSLKKWVDDFTLFERCLISINIIMSITLMIVYQDYGVIGAIGFVASVTNTICVVLVAKRRISNFIWGIIGVSTYTVVAFWHGNTGEWTIHAFWYLPMNIVGWYLWAKNKNSDTVAADVISKKLTVKQSVIVYSLTAIGTLIFAYIISLEGLHLFIYNQTFEHGFSKYLTDSFSSILAVTAMILMAKRYREQWVLWIIINITNLFLWGIFTFDPMMILMWSCFLVNSVYGWLKWQKAN